MAASCSRTPPPTGLASGCEIDTLSIGYYLQRKCGAEGGDGDSLKHHAGAEHALPLVL
jgi:hypothetical protein